MQRVDDPACFGSPFLVRTVQIHSGEKSAAGTEEVRISHGRTTEQGTEHSPGIYSIW